MAISKELRLRPVVAFDVDGVLRVRKLKPTPEGFTRLGDEIIQDLFPAEILMHRDEYPTLFHGAPRWDEDGTSSGTDYFSVAGAQFLRSVVEDLPADAVWATTWQRWANSYFAEHLGIPHLPVAVVTLEDPDANWFRGGSPAWKSSQLSRQFDGRPLIWLDDNMPERPYERLIELRRPVDRALTLSYRVNPLTGITPEDVEKLTAWIELASTEEGQAELRQKRRDEQAAERARWAKDQRLRERRHRIFLRTLELMEELYPGQDYFNRDVARMAEHKEGLIAENISYALKRHSLKADPDELSRKLRVRGYHFKERQPDGWDEDLDF